MLKSIFYSILMISVLTTISCRRLGTLSIDRDLSVDFDINALAAGEAFNKSLPIPLDIIKQALNEQSTSNVQLEKLNLKSIKFSVADTSQFIFDNVESIQILLEGAEVASKTTGLQGKKLEIDAPTDQSDYKSAFLNASAFKSDIKFKAKNATKASKMYLSLKFHIEADLVLY